MRRYQSSINYLSQTVASLLGRLPATDTRLFMEMLNVDWEPAEHKEAHALSDLIPLTDLHDTFTHQFKHSPPPQRNETRVLLRLEVLDYALALRRYHRMGCQYVLLLEDDVVADRGWFQSIQRALRQLEHNYKNEWLVLKLFCSYGDWWATAGNSAVQWRALKLAAPLALITLLILYTAVLKRHTREQQSLNLCIIFVCWWFLTVCYLATHQTPLGRG
jgi:hypothetical protein